MIKVASRFFRLMTVLVLLSCSGGQTSDFGHDPVNPETPVNPDPVSGERPIGEYLSKCLTKPEMLQDMDQLLRDVVDSLEEIGITYWLEGGTLLGAYRFGSHMPFDDDVDLSILRDEYEQNRAKLIEELNKRGYLLERANPDLDTFHAPYVVSKSDPENAPRLDLFLFEVDKQDSDRYVLSQTPWQGHIKGSGFTREMIFGAKNGNSLPKVRILDREYSVPTDIPGYVGQWYEQPDILTNFLIKRLHASGYCGEKFAKVPDITKDKESLNSMLEHLKQSYGNRFNRASHKMFKSKDFKQARYVIAHYKEDLSWLEPVLDRATIYHKGPDDFSKVASNKWVPLPNLGREGHTYLTHIIENYDNLDEVTVFLQGTIDDHLENKDWLDLAEEAQGEGFSSLTPVHMKGLQGDLDFISNELPIHPKYGVGLSHSVGFKGFWHEIFNAELDRDYPMFHYGCFAVRKDRILQHEKEWYIKVRSFLGKSSNPIEGHFLERAWHCIFNECPGLKQ